MCAAANGFLGAVIALAEGGADLLAVNLDGDTSLHLAAERGKIEVVRSECLLITYNQSKL